MYTCTYVCTCTGCVKYRYVTDRILLPCFDTAVHADKSPSPRVPRNVSSRRGPPTSHVQVWSSRAFWRSAHASSFRGTHAYSGNGWNWRHLLSSASSSAFRLHTHDTHTSAAGEQTATPNTPKERIIRTTMNSPLRTLRKRGSCPTDIGVQRGARGRFERLTAVVASDAGVTVTRIPV